MEDWHATLISGFGGAIVGGLAAIVASVWSTRILSRSEVAEHFVSKVGGVMTGID